MSSDQYTGLDRRSEDRTLAALVTQMGALHADVGVIKTSMTSFSDGMDRLTKAVTQLAVVEERQTHAQQAQERLFKAHDEMRADIKASALRITELEKSEPAQSRAAEWVDRAVWAAASAAVMMAAAKAGLF